jgi:hypothetical protein
MGLKLSAFSGTRCPNNSGLSVRIQRDLVSEIAGICINFVYRGFPDSTVCVNEYKAICNYFFS